MKMKTRIIRTFFDRRKRERGRERQRQKKETYAKNSKINIGSSDAHSSYI